MKTPQPVRVHIDNCTREQMEQIVEGFFKAAEQLERFDRIAEAREAAKLAAEREKAA